MKRADKFNDCNILKIEITHLSQVVTNSNIFCNKNEKISL